MNLKNVRLYERLFKSLFVRCFICSNLNQLTLPCFCVPGTFSMLSTGSWTQCFDYSQVQMNLKTNSDCVFSMRFPARYSFMPAASQSSKDKFLLSRSLLDQFQIPLWLFFHLPNVYSNFHIYIKVKLLSNIPESYFRFEKSCHFKIHQIFKIIYLNLISRSILIIISKCDLSLPEPFHTQS